MRTPEESPAGRPIPKRKRGLAMSRARSSTSTVVIWSVTQARSPSRRKPRGRQLCRLRRASSYSSRVTVTVSVAPGLATTLSVRAAKPKPRDSSAYRPGSRATANVGGRSAVRSTRVGADAPESSGASATDPCASSADGPNVASRTTSPDARAPLPGARISPGEIAGRHCGAATKRGSQVVSASRETRAPLAHAASAGPHRARTDAATLRARFRTARRLTVRRDRGRSTSWRRARRRASARSAG
jgi:hypothetical protein